MFSRHRNLDLTNLLPLVPVILLVVWVFVRSI